MGGFFFVQIPTVPGAPVANEKPLRAAPAQLTWIMAASGPLADDDGIRHQRR